MKIMDIIGKLLAGERNGTSLWKIPLGEIAYEAITDPAEGVLVASLAENILRCGLLQPILISKCEKRENTAEKYTLVAGRRRLEAVRMLGRTHIDAIVVSCEQTASEMLTLSENLMRSDPDYLRVAELLLKMENAGMVKERIRSMLALTEREYDGLRRLLLLPPDQLAAIKKANISKTDALRLAELEASLRQAALAKCTADLSMDVSAFIREVCEKKDPELTQTRKVMVADARMFVNSVDRAAETMRKAGYDISVCRSEDEDEYTFTIRAARRKGEHLKDVRVSRNVSRETSGAAQPKRRFSSALNIFEALAEEERTLGENVSRETLEEVSAK